MRYVAFCDVLGFSRAVETQFDETIAIYREFTTLLRDWPFPERAQASVYSDSILIVSEHLPSVLHAVQSLWFVTLAQGWLLRGGIAYGKYWEERPGGNLLVVSDALVRAVRLESTVRVPAVAIDSSVEIPLSAWVPRLKHGLFNSPLLHFQELNVANPFSIHWFASARLRVAELWKQFPEHEEKYRWFTALWEAVERDEPLIPQSVLDELLRLGVLQMHTG